jgi:hypothetical protein
MQALLARAARRGYVDPTTTGGRITLQPQLPGRVRQDWWAHSLVAFAQDSGDSLVLTKLEESPHQHITDTFPSLSTEALELLEMVDVAVVEELIEPSQHCDGLVPIPWLAASRHLGASQLLA